MGDVPHTDRRFIASSQPAGTTGTLKGHRRPTHRGVPSVAHHFRMTEDDTVPADASLLEDILELSLLTAGPPTGPTDLSREDHQLD
jgi:hypothetical protein